MLKCKCTVVHEKITPEQKAYDALCVIALDPKIRAFLTKEDPQAFEQVNNALDALECGWRWVTPNPKRRWAQPDFTYRDEGTVMLLTPCSYWAHGWVEEHIPDDAQWFGASVVIERRYFADILNGIDSAGMTYAES